jgi:hypothetical protein
VEILSHVNIQKMYTTLKVNQHQTIGELRQKFLLLTDSDLLLLENKQDEILKRLHKKAYKVYGEKRKCIAEA